VGIEFRVLGPRDDELLLNAAAGVFDNPPHAKLTAEFLTDPRHHIVVAIDAGQVVGFVSALHYVHPDKAAELWLNEVSVASSHQDRRLARRMLQDMLALGRQLGCRCAWVLTHRANTLQSSSSLSLQLSGPTQPAMPRDPSLNRTPAGGLASARRSPVSYCCVRAHPR